MSACHVHAWNRRDLSGRAAHHEANHPPCGPAPPVPGRRPDPAREFPGEGAYDGGGARMSQVQLSVMLLSSG